MSHSLYDRLQPFAARRVVALLMVIYLVLFLVVFPAVTSRLDALAGRVGLIDTQLGYSPAQAFAMVAAYGPEGRSLYLLSIFTADLLFPLDYSLLMALLIVLTFRQAFPGGGLARAAVFIPFLAAAADLLENAGAAILLLSFPEQPWLVAQAAGVFTLLKWVFFSLAALLVVVGFVGLARVRQRPGASA